MTARADEPGALGGENLLLGIVLMLAGMATLNLMDAISKYLTGTHPGMQVVWARYAFHLLPMLVFAGPRRVRGMLRTGHLRFQILRSLAFTVSSVCIIFAFALMPLADAIAITFIAPLIIVALSARFLGEHVGPHRWIAVLTGFGGMLLMVWPSGGVLDPGAAFAACAALFWAIGQMLTRQVRGDDPWSTLFYTALVGMVLVSLVVPFYWTAPTPRGWALMATMGVLAGVAHALIIYAFRHAGASLLAPFNYSMLLWATLFGWLFFSQWPGPRVAMGAAIIAAAGLYVWHRERVRAA